MMVLQLIIKPNDNEHSIDNDNIMITIGAGGLRRVPLLPEGSRLMYSCMYVCTYVCTYVYVIIYVCICMYMYICIYVFMHV